MEIILKIAGIGLLTALVTVVLKKSGKEEIATVAALAGLVLTLMLVVDMVTGLFDTIKTIFALY